MAAPPVTVTVKFFGRNCVGQQMLEENWRRESVRQMCVDKPFSIVLVAISSNMLGESVAKY